MWDLLSGHEKHEHLWWSLMSADSSLTILTLYVVFFPFASTNKKQENSWSKTAKIQATNDGRGVRNATKRTEGAESVFVLSLTRLWFQTKWSATWSVARNKKLYKYLRRLLYSVTRCHIIWSGLVSQDFFPSAGYPVNEIRCYSLASGARCGVVGWGTALQAEGRGFDCLGFFIDLILPSAIRFWGPLSL